MATQTSSRLVTARFGSQAGTTKHALSRLAESVMVGSALVFCLVMPTQAARGISTGPLVPPPMPATAAPAPSLASLVAAFYEDRAKPLEARYQRQSSAAADRAIRRIQEGVDGFDDGVDGFVADLTSYATRWELFQARCGDKWNERQGASSAELAILNARFEAWIVSEVELIALVQDSLEGYLHDLAAARNELMVDLDRELRDYSRPRLWTREDREKVKERLAQMILRDIADEGSRSLETLALANLGVTGAVVGLRVVSRLMVARVAMGLVARFVPGVGAAGAVLFGSTPPGWLVIGGALLVEVIADYWAESSYADELTARCHAILADTSVLLIEGDAAGDAEGADQETWLGLRKILTEDAKQSSEAVSAAVRAAILEEE